MADEAEDNPDRSEAPKGNGLAPGEIKSTLRKPIMANGEEVSELVFREPTGGDIERAGNPVIVDVFSGDTIKLTFDEKKMTAMMSRLAAVPPSSIRMLHPKDWNSIAWQLVHFFTPDL